MTDVSDSSRLKHADGQHVALVSGGMDSAVAAHVSVRWGPCDLLVHLDTGTGTEANRRYINRFADHLGVQLWTLRTQENYGEKVREHGFPGPSRHNIMYRSLKERQIQRLASRVGDHLHCWTGVRRMESERRMRTVDPHDEQTEGRWTWHAPIHGWSDEDCRRYLDRFGIPRNPLWRTLGRSGDCFCGCFGTREELIDLRAAGCDNRADALERLEDEIDAEDETGLWAWGSLSDVEQRAVRAEGRDMTLCSSCGYGELLTDGGGT